MKLPSKFLEKKLFENGYRTIVGVDEVGMGCLAGPVTVCAVAFTEDFYRKAHKKLHWLRDSKLLSAKQREIYSNILENIGIDYAVISESPKAIDRLNVYQASREAMKKAIARLAGREQWTANGKEVKGEPLTTNHSLPAIVLVDGNKEIHGLKIDQAAFVKGDRRIFAIACASVIAKVHRDKLMVRQAKRYPGYGFEIHKGYGTRLHYQRLHELGVSPIHRRSFKLVSHKVHPLPPAG